MAKYDDEIIKALGGGPYPGPWWSEEGGEVLAKSRRNPGGVVYIADSNEIIDLETAAYIAACSPANIAPLVAEVRRLRADAARIERMAEYMIGQRGIGGDTLYVFATPILRAGDSKPTADDLRAAIDTALR
jgi:hypothetical protein